MIIFQSQSELLVAGIVINKYDACLPIIPSVTGEKEWQSRIVFIVLREGIYLNADNIMDGGKQTDIVNCKHTHIMYLNVNK